MDAQNLKIGRVQSPSTNQTWERSVGVRETSLYTTNLMIGTVQSPPTNQTWERSVGVRETSQEAQNLTIGIVQSSPRIRGGRGQQGSGRPHCTPRT